MEVRKRNLLGPTRSILGPTRSTDDPLDRESAHGTSARLPTTASLNKETGIHTRPNDYFMPMHRQSPVLPARFTASIPKLIALLVSAAAVIVLFRGRIPLHPGTIAASLPSTVPWKSIGGCGAGISSPGGGAPGALSVPLWPDPIPAEKRFGVQTLVAHSRDQLYSLFAFPLRLTWFPHRRIQLGSTIPFVRNAGEAYAPRAFSPTSYTTGGLADISVDARLLLIPENPVVAALAVQFPTGAYDISRGAESYASYLPVRFQPGTGVYALALTLRHQRKMFAKGLWHFGAGYAAPFQMRPVSGKNEFIDGRLEAYAQEKSGKRFYYRFKPYGENDLGRVVPSELLLDCRYSHIVNSLFRHTWVVRLTLPFGVHWIHDERIDRYDPRPDPEHRMWKSTWIYMPELRVKGFSAVCFVGLSLNDKANDGNPENMYDDTPYARSDGADWNSFLRESYSGLGVRYRFK